MADCSSKERDEELQLFLQNLLQSGGFVSASVLASYECPEHGRHVESFVCSQDRPNARDHVRQLIDRMRQYADTLEGHFFAANPQEPVKQSYGPQN